MGDPLWHDLAMRIYTRTGDDGSTGLYGGDRVSKAHARVDAFGTVDELNAVLGWARVAPIPPTADDVLAKAQDACFRLGAVLASAPGKDPGIEPLGDSDVETLECAIDSAEEGLPLLKNFILPGGSEAGARLQVARAVCRRAERALVGLSASEEVDPTAVRWVNRLSDLLFVAARLANKDAEVHEVVWQPKK